MTRATLSVLIIIQFIAFQSVFADKLPKFGKVSREELQMSTLPEDPDADAVYLFEEGDLKLMEGSNNYFIEREQRVRIKILTEEGKKYADIKLPFWHEDKLRNIKAHTILPDGKKIKLKKKDIFEEKNGKFKTISFAIPGVEVGAVIEYKYKLISKYIRDLEPWYFQNPEYTKLSRYSVTVRPYFKYTAFYRNMTEIEPQKEGYFLPGERKQLTKFTWEMRDLPPIREEPYMRTTNDYRAAVHFQLLEYSSPYAHHKYVKEWSDLAKAHQKYYDEFMSKDKTLKAIVAEQVSDSMSALEKIKALYAWVQNEVDTDGKGFTGIDNEPKKVAKERKGKATEKNLLLINLLRIAGMEAYPLLISTRGNGIVIRNQPRITQFNHLLAGAMVGKRLYIMDTRYKNYPFGMLPRADLVDVAFLINKPGQFIKLQPPKKLNMTYCKADLALAEDGSLSASAYMRLEAYRAVFARNDILDDGQEAYLKSMLEKHFEKVELDSFEITNVDNPEMPLYIKATFHVPEYAQIIGNMMYVNTPALSKLTENPFKREKRYFPVEFAYNSAATDDISLTLPDGFSVIELPNGKKVNRKDQKISFIDHWSADGNKVTLQRQFMRRKLVYKPRDYAFLRGFYDQMVGADQAQLVLGPKENQGVSDE